jgi:hypothetical protein
MDKDEVIALAEKCKLAVLIHSQWTAEIKEFTVVDYVVEGDLGSLMQFADLVAERERKVMQAKIETLYAMYELAVKQRDYLMDQQSAQVAAMRGRVQ